MKLVQLSIVQKPDVVYFCDGKLVISEEENVGYKIIFGGTGLLIIFRKTSFHTKSYPASC